jgi:hypothetical protein
MKVISLLAVASACSVLLSVGCDSSDDQPAPSGPVGGPVVGPEDAHCAGQEAVEVDPATCHAASTDDGTGEGGASGTAGDAAGAGGSDCNQTHDADYGDTLFNTAGDDDDCKYHVSWTSTPIRLNQDVTFTVTATDLVAGKPLEPLAGQSKAPLSRVETYLPCDPNWLGPPNFKTEFTQTMPGVFQGGPVRFDRAGRWAVRFHFYEDCNDGEHSPHGHIAFFVDVP